MKIRNVMLAIFCLMLIFTGCATNKAVEEESEYLETLGDFDPFLLGPVMGLWKSGDDVKSCECDMYFVPRTNSVELYFSYGMNKICIMLDAKACDGFKTMVEAYMNDYSNRTFADRKPDSKNKYGSINAEIAWGVFGYSYDAGIRIDFNYELIGGKPYFMMKMNQGFAKDNDHSPVMTMYFNPLQLENIFTLADPKVIQEYISEKEKLLNGFDTVSYDF